MVTQIEKNTEKWLFSGKIQRFKARNKQLELLGKFLHNSQFMVVKCHCDLRVFKNISSTDPIGAILDADPEGNYIVKEIWNDPALPTEFEDIYYLFEQIAHHVFGPAN
jgi:hypothetical protein